MSKKKLYERYHENRSRQRHVITDRNITYVNLIPLLNNCLFGVKNVLDIGCGVGTLSLYLGDKGYHVDGIDVSQKAIEKAELAAKDFNLSRNVEFSVGDVETIKFTKKYDLIIVSETLEHVENDDKLMRKINRSLRKNGILFCTVPSINAPLYRFGFLTDFDSEVGHLRRYDSASLRDKIKRNDFRIVSFHKRESFLRNLLYTNTNFSFVLKFIRGPLVRPFTFVDSIFVDLFGESQLIVIAQRK